MSDRTNSDPDLPRRSRLLRRMHARFGHLAIGIAVRLRRPVSIGVRLMALNQQGEILLVRQTYLPGLMLPGGAVDPGETCREAAIREAREEAGAQVNGPVELFHVYLNRALGNRDHVVLYVTRDAEQVNALAPGLEILSSGFFPLDALPEDVTPATRRRIAEVLHGAKTFDEW